jgi:hypothetical protein
MPSLRTLLILSRASNLPTVWSNCLAAWWLGGAGTIQVLPTLLIGASLLYIGGMFLNDVVDASFDRQHRRERPIPSGQISERLARRISIGLLFAGAVLMMASAVVGLPDQTAAPEGISVSSPTIESNGQLRITEAPVVENETNDLGPSLSARPWPDETTSVLPLWRIRGIRNLTTTLVLTMVLVALIVLYDYIHKAVSFSPLLMGACRSLLFLSAASVGMGGVTGLAVWSALALGAYVAGISYFARLERMLRRPEWWPCALLAVPVLLAFIVNQGPYRRDSLLLSLILVLWVVRSLRPALGPSQQNISRAVAALLAGIVFVDLLAICGAPRELSVVFLVLFAVTLLFQKFVPAT